MLKMSTARLALFRIGFFGPADSAQIDTGRQAFLVYFNEEVDAYRFKVSIRS